MLCPKRLPVPEIRQSAVCTAGRIEDSGETYERKASILFAKNGEQRG